MARGWHSPDALDGVDVPQPTLVERHSHPQPWSASWFDPSFVPEIRLVDQVYGICFDSSGSILLVCSHDLDGTTPYWNLPGGGLEDGETFEECLAREVAEEACAEVMESHYLGCQRVDEFPAGEARTCFQLRYWARVRLHEWAPAHETFARRLVPPDSFLTALAWGDAATARLILERGLEINSRR